VYLKVTDRYAGDNYQVQVKKCAPGGCDAAPPAGGVLDDRVVALSPIFTAWKRIHIERDKMFRKGGVLAEDYIPEPDCGSDGTMCVCTPSSKPACCTGPPPALYCNQIVAYEWQNAAENDQVAVFDEVFTYETVREPRAVTAVGTPDATEGLIVLTLDQGLSLAYLRSSRTLSTPYQPTFSNLKSAGYGVISGCDPSSNQINAANSCFWEGDLRAVEKAFGDGFIEIVSPRSGMSTVPLVGSPWFTSPPELGLTFFSGTWFRGWDPDLDYFHLIGANRDVFITRYGLANAHYNYVFVFRNSIWLQGMSEGKSDVEIDNFTREVTIHELGHQFKVNECTTGGHDSRNAWCEAEGSCGPGGTAPQPCVMVPHPEQSVWDSVFRFCAEDLFKGDPTCPDPQPGEPRAGAMRTVSDPP